jgi:hypothetical protein
MAEKATLNTPPVISKCVNGETYLGDNERIEPHYTHPSKDLTDEEIDDIASMCSVNEKDQINDREFARAILKKASEK